MANGSQGPVGARAEDLRAALELADTYRADGADRTAFERLRAGVTRFLAGIGPDGRRVEPGADPVQTHPVHRGRAAAYVFAPEHGGRRGIVPVEVIFEDGEFYAIYVCEEYDDGDAGESLEAWVEANGDECWATLDDHRDGPTLSLRQVAARAAEASLTAPGRVG